jgi:hypothetical protein
MRISPSIQADDVIEEVEEFVQPLPAARITVMEGERELMTGLLAKDASFRLIASGKIGVKEMERLIQKLEIEKEILADHDEESEVDFSKSLKEVIGSLK